MIPLPAYGIAALGWDENEEIRGGGDQNIVLISSCATGAREAQEVDLPGTGGNNVYDALLLLCEEPDKALPELAERFLGPVVSDGCEETLRIRAAASEFARSLRFVGAKITDGKASCLSFKLL